MKPNKAGKTLLWDITRRCNLNCIHCYNGGDSIFSEEINIVACYQDIIKTVKDIGVKHIHLIGGEPLLVQGVWEMIQYATNAGVDVTINTNGTLLTPENLQKIYLCGIAQITVSLDGTSVEVNDNIRGEGVFDTVCENLRKTVAFFKENDSDMIIQVAMVLTKRNYLFAHEMPKLLSSMGIHNLSILKLYECGNVIDNMNDLQLDDESYVRTVSKILIESYRCQVFTQVDCKPLALELMNTRYGFGIKMENHFLKCPAVEKILFMDYKGAIFPCGPFAYSHSMYESNYTISVFDEQLPGKIGIIEKYTKEKKRSAFMSGICETCRYNNNCNECPLCLDRNKSICEAAFRLYGRR